MRLILDENLPGFLEALNTDAHQNRDLLRLWGTSRNIDESQLSSGTRTVPANVIRFLNSILRVQYDENSVYGHAGLTHTYGYLMSNLSTPFGYKRARYVNGEMEAGFSLTPRLLSGLPSQGTLLSNLTRFAGRIAFRDHPKLLSRPELAPLEIDSAALRAKRLVETVVHHNFVLELRTDIVPFTFMNRYGKNVALLVYSVDFHKQNEPSDPRLITVFPVEKNFAGSLFAPAGLGESKSIKLKYNAALPVEIPAQSMVGSRKVIDESN